MWRVAIGSFNPRWEKTETKDDIQAEAQKTRMRVFNVAMFLILIVKEFFLLT